MRLNGYSNSTREERCERHPDIPARRVLTFHQIAITGGAARLLGKRRHTGHGSRPIPGAILPPARPRAPWRSSRVEPLPQDRLLCSRAPSAISPVGGLVSGDVEHGPLLPVVLDRRE